MRALSTGWMVLTKSTFGLMATPPHDVLSRKYAQLHDQLPSDGRGPDNQMEGRDTALLKIQEVNYDTFPFPRINHGNPILRWL